MNAKTFLNCGYANSPAVGEEAVNGCVIHLIKENTAGRMKNELFLDSFSWKLNIFQTQCKY